MRSSVVVVCAWRRRSAVVRAITDAGGLLRTAVAQIVGSAGVLGVEVTTDATLVDTEGMSTVTARGQWARSSDAMLR